MHWPSAVGPLRRFHPSCLRSSQSWAARSCAALATPPRLPPSGFAGKRPDGVAHRSVGPRPYQFKVIVPRRRAIESGLAWLDLAYEQALSPGNGGRTTTGLGGRESRPVTP